MTLRYFVERVALVVVAILLWRCWFLDGVLVPNRVDSGSMAPTIMGAHRRVVCTDCGFVFRCGADHRPVAPRAVCPNCGYPENRMDEWPDLAGDGLLLDRSVYSWRPPQRWEVVSFRHPAKADQVCVKRVVGLPGESIEIRNGDVYVDGQIQRKTLDQQRSMAILVHDATHAPTLNPLPPERWGGMEAVSQWGAHGGRFAHALSLEQDDFDWLVYRHWRRLARSSGKVERGPIDDTCGYNQKHPRRAEDVSSVRDLLLSFDLVRAWGDGSLAVRWSDGTTDFQFHVNPSTERYQVLRNGQVLPDGKGRLPGPIGRNQFELSTMDHQFIVAMDRKVIGTWPGVPVEEPDRPTDTPVQIGVMRLGAVIEHVRLFRDVYYTHPTGLRARWGVGRPVQLGSRELFVLGDNSPVSEDSRTWEGGPGVAVTLLTGRPLLIHFPSRQIRLGPWEFQVPDPTRMRYIP